MGIALSVKGNDNYFHSAYWHFHIIRTKLAVLAGIDLNQINMLLDGLNLVRRVSGEYFGDFECFPSTEALDALVPDTNTPKKKWNKGTDPIIPFLKHSDCNGYIGPKQCGAMIKRMRSLLAVWPKADEDYDSMRLIIELMEYAASNGKRLIFS